MNQFLDAVEDNLLLAFGRLEALARGAYGAVPRAGTDQTHSCQLSVRHREGPRSKKAPDGAGVFSLLETREISSAARTRRRSRRSGS
jgi:hypothetical protein